MNPRLDGGDAPIPHENTRVYAIGDVHGRLDLLERAIAAIRRDVETHGSDALTVTLGDYVDRGPDTCGVLGRLATNPFPTPYVALRGNHEAMMMDFLANPGVGRHWYGQGGAEALQSYGVTLRPSLIGRSDQDVAERLRAAMPAAQKDFLNALKGSFSHGRYFFCHAGVRPGVPLEEQSAQDLMWIRHPFLTCTESFGKIVVHGHTPVPAPEVLPNRVNIDTGAVITGRLTCAVLGPASVRFLDV
jgi:serine/threonine protein phosphatase 1